MTIFEKCIRSPNTTVKGNYGARNTNGYPIKIVNKNIGIPNTTGNSNKWDRNAVCCKRKQYNYKLV